MNSFDDVLSYSGSQPRWMQPPGETAGTSDGSGHPQHQSMRGGKQTRGRQMHRHSATSSPGDESSLAARCQNQFGQGAAGGRADGGVGRQKKGRTGQRNSAKSSHDNASLTSLPSCSYPAGPETQSPALPQSASLNHPLPQGMHLSHLHLVIFHKIMWLSLK